MVMDTSDLGEQLVGELSAVVPAHAPTMGQLGKVSYTHLDMIDWIIAHPGYRLQDLAARYGYSVPWISNIMASDAFKAAYAARREEVMGPMLATIQEQFEGVTRLALDRLGERLATPAVENNVILRAVELGAKAMGVGGNAPPPAQVPQADHLAQLANRLIDLQSRVRQGVTIDQQASAA